MTAVEPVDLLNLVQALLAVAVARVLVLIAQDLQPMLVRHVRDSIRDSVSWL